MPAPRISTEIGTSPLKELHEEEKADQAEAEAIQKAAAAARADQRVDQAKVGELEGATQARKSDPCVGHGNGSQVQQEVVQNVGGIGNSHEANGTGTAGQVDKSALPISAPRRVRNKQHLRYVASQPCLVCGRSPGHAHHVRYAQPRAMGRKVPMPDDLGDDIDRIIAIWADCHHKYGDNGGWLFGDFSIADAMYAPVVLRLRTYGINLPESAGFYPQRLLESSAMQEWLAAAESETEVIDREEKGQ